MSKELIFASEEEALQHLANETGKQIIIAAEEKASPSEISEFTDAYIEAMLWSTSDMDEKRGECLDANFKIEDIAPEFMKKIKSDCKKFIEENYEFIPEDDIRKAGVDFWLTRAGHGAGFWDGDWKNEVDGKNAGEHLTKAADAYGSIDPYVGDDGKIYGM